MNEDIQSLRKVPGTERTSLTPRAWAPSLGLSPETSAAYPGSLLGPLRNHGFLGFLSAQCSHCSQSRAPLLP